MKQYKHKTGKVFTQSENLYYYHNETECVPYYIIENSGDWQELKEYPIGTIVEDKITETPLAHVKAAMFIKTNKGYEPYSFVQNIIFPYDTIEKEIGKRFKVISNKTPLFITEDGVEILDLNENVVCVNTCDAVSNYKSWNTLFRNIDLKHPSFKLFKSLEVADKWIDENKPRFSKKQLEEALQNSALKYTTQNYGWNDFKKKLGI